MEKNKMDEEAKELIDRFKRTFYLKFGVEPVVKYDLSVPFLGKITMSELMKIVDKTLNKDLYFEGTYATILCKSRKRPVIYYRHAFCKMCLDLSYSCTQIAKYINMNHASVLHSNKLVSNLLETNDAEMIKIINDIKESINEYINERDNDLIIQQDNGFRLDA